MEIALSMTKSSMDFHDIPIMVVSSTGLTEQVTHYYPYGGVIGGIDKAPTLQPYKFGENELERTYGLDWYDIHARQYDPVVPSWNKIDPLCENYYNTSPYAYCCNNPVNAIDPDGRNPVYSANGIFIANTREGFTGQIYVYTGSDNLKFEDMTMDELLNMNNPDLMTYDKFARSYSSNALSGFVSNVMTDIMQQFEGVNIFGTKFDISNLYKGKVEYKERENSSFVTEILNGQIHIIANRPISPDYEATVENLASSLIVHEWHGHGIMGYGSYHTNSFGEVHPNHHLVYKKVMDFTPFSSKTTFRYLLFLNNRYNYYLMKEGF
jgi:RHS repeat-associated protein